LIELYYIKFIDESRVTMSDNSTSKRRYTSTRRQAQAADTRRQIIAAAGVLFSERGYSGTTMEDIARSAGTAVQTIYTAFGSKRAILARLVEVSVGGDEATVPILERPGPEAVRHETNQQRQLQLFAQGIAQIMERMSPIFEIMRVAAKSEPEIAEFQRQLLEERLQNLTSFVGWLAANGPLRDGLGVESGGETVWALTSAEVYRLLTADRGWSPEQYERWLSGTLIRLLLP
jgi:AcrR family transcriptional regulator